MGSYKRSNKETIKLVKAIGSYIEQHNHEKNFTTSIEFADAVTKADGSKYNLNDPVDRRNYQQYMIRLRRKDYLRYSPAVYGGKCVWSVNPKYLDKTGVVTHIPLQRQSQPPTILLPKEPEINEETIRQQAVAFIEEEMKKIKLQEVRFGKGDDRCRMINSVADIDMHNVTLYDVYKIGLAASNTLGLEYRLEQNTLFSEECRYDDSEEETKTEIDTDQTSSGDDQFEFDQTETEYGRPF